MYYSLTKRFLWETDKRLVWKLFWNMGVKGLRAVQLHKRRLKRGQFFPPYLYISIINSCNLRCQGCWVDVAAKQQKIDLPGRDLGMVFLGGEYLGTYARVSRSEAWNTTIHSGGRYAAHTPGDEVVELARRAQALFNMDFTTVDVAETVDGPIVFEVSAFGGFRGARDGMGINAAALYLQHVLRELAWGD